MLPSRTIVIIALKSVSQSAKRDDEAAILFVYLYSIGGYELIDHYIVANQSDCGICDIPLDS